MVNFFSAKRATPKSQGRPTWNPPALRWWNLCLLTLLCWFFIALLQYFLTKSQNDGGVLFAAKVNDLPLRRTFAYLYLPTICAVIFSIYLAWVDLDAKRFEPYHQLSKPGGALGKDSLLLHYPNEFIPIVPFFALKNRHWLVFWASTATVLTTFGIVPLQAGIFSTEKVTRTFPQAFEILSSPFLRQEEALISATYSQSAYGILKLNETLPPFMTHNYTLAPFSARELDTPPNSTWIARTMMYGLDLECNDARSWNDDDGYPAFNMSTSDCRYFTNFDYGNDTIGTKPNVPLYAPTLKTMRFSAIYAGAYIREFSGGVVSADGNLATSRSCRNETENGTFLATLVENKAKEEEPRKNATAIFCRPMYYEQPVIATVDAITKTPLSVAPLEGKRPLSAEVNTTMFQGVINSGSISDRFTVRKRENSLPNAALPQYRDNLEEAGLSEVMLIKEITEPDWLHPLAAMALTTSDRALEDNLDPAVLKESYQKAYRLLFARAMSDTLNADFSSATTQVAGERRMDSEAVVLEPVFTYIVEAFLGFVSISALALLFISVVRCKNKVLCSDPGTISASMSLVADNEPLLSKFADVDGGSTKHLQQCFENRRYRIDKDTCSIVEMPPSRATVATFNSAAEELAKPTRPKEFRLFAAVPFTSLFVALAILGGVLYTRSKPHGLTLPSKNRLVQNIVREYVPTVLATLIEPMWILINRLLCMLQPLQGLQTTRASASRSIDLNYSSLPPQLTIFKALGARHIVLAAVCAMALLANLLAISFSGLLFQDTIGLLKPTSFQVPFVAQFVEINGASGPILGVLTQDTSKANYSGAYRGGNGEGQFLVAESNYSRSALLSPWTDEHAFYLPFLDPRAAQTDSDTFIARTKYFSADLNCKTTEIPLRFDSKEGMSVQSGRERFQPYKLTVEDAKGNRAGCFSSADIVVGDGFQSAAQSGSSTFWNRPAGQSLATGTLGGELVTTLHAGPNHTDKAQETCQSTVVVGWFRVPLNGTQNATSSNSLFLTCQPRMVIGDATVTVNSEGRIIQKVLDRTPDPDHEQDGSMEKYFTNGQHNLVSQSNLFLFRSLLSVPHNDSIASEYIHYFVNRAANHTRFTDPSQPILKFTDVEGPLKEAHSRLFALFLGVHKDLLLTPANATNRPVISGSIIYQEERLFFKKALFIISEVILGIYIIASILVYLRRPGRFLPRMPTSLAAVIALFAASAAVEDLRGTSRFSTKQREQYLKENGFRYGYGSYVGGDGSVHVGIEKSPFVRSMGEKTTFEHSRFDRERRRTATMKQNGASVTVTAATPMLSGDQDDQRTIWQKIAFWKK